MEEKCVWIRNLLIHQDDKKINLIEAIPSRTIEIKVVDSDKVFIEIHNNKIHQICR